MPAIQPARLRQQAILLAEHFDEPPVFVRSLHHLLDFYAERVQRPGQTGEPPPLIAAYRARPPVLRLLIQELTPFAKDDPESALILCDRLWEQPFLEFRLLAAALLGQIPAHNPEPILERIRAWIMLENEPRLTLGLLDQGLASLRQENLASLIRLIDDWLIGTDQLNKQLGLWALIPVIKDTSFENLPIFFRMIQPLCRDIPGPLRPDLLDVLAELIHRTPSETAYFLRHILELSSSPDTAWLIRQSLREFPPESAANLREAVRKSKIQEVETRT